MTFKDFLKMSEEASPGDRGLMGFQKASSVRKPSDGQPFKNLSPVAGQEPRPNSGGGAPMGGSPLAFMKKKMKRV
jgi:hypothetical protein